MSQFKGQLRIAQQRGRGAARPRCKPDMKAWGPWVWCNHTITWPTAPPGLLRVCYNNVFSVQFYQQATDLFGLVDHLMVRRNDEGVTVLWWELQMVKDTLGFCDRFAVEIYPPIDEVIDDANLHYVWLLSEGVHLPLQLS